MLPAISFENYLKNIFQKWIDQLLRSCTAQTQVGADVSILDKEDIRN